MLIIAGVVPFLTFFMLSSKEHMSTRMNAFFSSKLETDRFITSLNQMVRGFVAGNMIIGSVMAVATTLVFMGLQMRGAIPLGIASGVLNLVPFLGLIFALALPLAGAILQFSTPEPFVIITLTVLVLHIVSANFLIPEIYRHPREHRAGCSDDWDPVLGLVVGCHGFTAGCAAHSTGEANRGLTSVLVPLLQHVGADPA